MTAAKSGLTDSGNQKMPLGATSGIFNFQLIINGNIE